MQKSSTSCAAVYEKDEDSNLPPIRRDRGHTISDMNPASRNTNVKNPIFGRRPTLTETTSIASTSITSLPTTETGSNIGAGKAKEKPERPPGLTPK